MTTEHPHHELRRPTASSQPISILLQAFSDISGIESDMYDVLSPEFVRMDVKARNVFYNNGDIANELFIVEQGELVLKLNDKDSSPVVETLIPGTMVVGLELFSNRARACSLISLT
jgi:CRP-like cAMP-binding protein